jgi:hypothetical protein
VIGVQAIFRHVGSNEAGASGNQGSYRLSIHFQFGPLWVLYC